MANDGNKRFSIKNRFKKNNKENTFFSGNLRKLLYVFYVFIGIIVIIGVLHFKGYDVIKINRKNLNLNISETVDLDAIYSSPNIEWVAVGDNVVVSNNVVTALKSGKAYLYAKENGIQVKDLTVNILTDKEALSLERHFFNFKSKGRGQKIKVKRNQLMAANSDSTFLGRLLRIMRDIFAVGRNREVPKTTTGSKANGGNTGTVSETGEIEDIDLEELDEEDWDNIDEEDFDFEDEEFDEDYFEDEDFDFEDDYFEDEDFDFEDEDFDFDEEFDEGFYDFSEDIDEGDDSFDSFDYPSSDGNDSVTSSDTPSDTVSDDVSDDSDEIGDFGGFDEAEEDDDTVFVEDEDFDLDLVYDSEDDDVAVVDEDGVVEPVNPGTVEIKVTDDFGNTDQAVVTVKKDVIDLANKEYFLNVGDKVDVVYNLISDAYKTDDIVWTSSDDNIVSVDKGVLTAKGVGEAVIYMAAGNIKAQMSVRVYENAKLPTDLVLPSTSIVVGVGVNYNLSASVVPSDASDSKLNWLSRNELVAFVANGVIIGKSPGETTVVVTTNNGIKKEFKVTVVNQKVPIESITVNSDKMDINIGEKKKLAYTIAPSNASYKTLRVDFDKNIIDVNNEGEVTGIKAGSSQVTITSDNGKSASMTVVVASPTVNVSAIKLNNTKLDMANGDSSKLVASVYPNNATQRNLSWGSSNNKVVVVDGAGNIKAVGVGTATITVSSSNQIKATCVVNVKDRIVKVNKITLNKSSLAMKVSTVYNLTATVSPSNASNKAIKWGSSDSKIVSVDNTGKLTAVAPGKAVIAAASVSDSNIVAKASIVVEKLSGGELILKNAEAYYRKIENAGNWVHRMDLEKYKQNGGWTESCKFASHVLEVSGYLKKGGYLCHANVDNSSNPKNADHVKNMTIIKTKDMNQLKPGDIMIRNGKNHHNVAIFAYKKDGNYYVYGASCTNEIRLKNHPAPRSWWKTYKITAIVRAK
ncbi:MAG: Ig-like domain-containing protein [Bacilli bacterium]|nr:Ig-like domain-containing protein [Bacilli bacterium]